METARQNPKNNVPTWANIPAESERSLRESNLEVRIVQTIKKEKLWKEPKIKWNAERKTLSSHYEFSPHQFLQLKDWKIIFLFRNNYRLRDDLKKMISMHILIGLQKLWSSL